MRVTTVQAVVATAVRHSAEEAANRIVPAAAPLLVDPVQEVRHTALAAVDAYVQILRDHNRTLDDSLTAAGESPESCPAGPHPLGPGTHWRPLSVSCSVVVLNWQASEAMLRQVEITLGCRAPQQAMRIASACREARCCMRVLMPAWGGLGRVIGQGCALRAGTANKDLQQGGPTTSGWSVGLNSNLGWAISSFGLTRGGKDPPSPAPGGPGAAPSTASSPSGGAAALAAPPQPAVPPSSSLAAEPPVSAAAEGWDNTGDSDDAWDDPDPEEAAARSVLSLLRGLGQQGNPCATVWTALGNAACCLLLDVGIVQMVRPGCILPPS